MIGSASPIAAQQLFNDALQQHAKLSKVQSPELQGLASPQGLTSPQPAGQTFDNLIGSLVEEVDAKGKAAAAETNKMLLGETDNIHQSMIAMQESSLAFTLMVEVRNKLVQSYQELIKMPV